MAQETFTIDTCVILMICKDSHRKGFAECLRSNNSFDGATILLNPRIVAEMEKRGLNRDAAEQLLFDELGARVTMVEITNDMLKNARRMVSVYPGLHRGDDEILACAVEYGSTLITCDRDFALAARQAGIHVHNPDIANAETRHRLEQRLGQHHMGNGSRKKRTSAVGRARAWVGRQNSLRAGRNTSQRTTAAQALVLQQKDAARRETKQKKSSRAKQMRRDHKKQLERLAQS